MKTKYLSSDSIDNFESIESQNFDALTPEFLNPLRTSGLPNHKIKLKVGTPIMLLRNIDRSKGSSNGTRLIVTRLANHVIGVKLMSANTTSNAIYIPRMSMSPS